MSSPGIRKKEAPPFLVFSCIQIYIINTPKTPPKHAKNTSKNVFFFIINADRGVLTGRRGVSSRYTNRRGTTEKPWNSGRRGNEKARTPIDSTLRPPGSAQSSGDRNASDEQLNRQPRNVAGGKTPN